MPNRKHVAVRKREEGYSRDSSLWVFSPILCLSCGLLCLTVPFLGCITCFFYTFFSLVHCLFPKICGFVNTLLSRILDFFRDFHDQVSFISVITGSSDISGWFEG